MVSTGTYILLMVFFMKLSVSFTLEMTLLLEICQTYDIFTLHQESEKSHHLKERFIGAGEMWLKIPAALAEDLLSAPSTHFERL